MSKKVEDKKSSTLDKLKSRVQDIAKARGESPGLKKGVADKPKQPEPVAKPEPPKPAKALTTAAAPKGRNQAGQQGRHFADCTCEACKKRRAINASKAPGGTSATPATTSPANAPANDPQPPADQPQLPQVDIVTPAVNALVVPLIAKRNNKKREQVMLTKTQMEEVAKLQPPNDWSKPSWVAYGVMTVSLIMINLYQAEDVKPDVTELKEVVEDIENTRKAKPGKGVKNG